MLNKYFKTELIVLVLMNDAVAVVQQLFDIKLFCTF